MARPLFARALVVADALLLVGAAALMLWPLHGNGLGGNAIRPDDAAVGWTSYTPPENLSSTEVAALIHAHSEPPVERRRQQAGSVAALGALLTVLGVAVTRRRVPVPS